jgi:hypothetical protein
MARLFEKGARPDDAAASISRLDTFSTAGWESECAQEPAAITTARRAMNHRIRGTDLGYRASD